MEANEIEQEIVEDLAWPLSQPVVESESEPKPEPGNGMVVHGEPTPVKIWFVTMRVPIQDLMVRPEIQVRSAINQDTVAEYTKIVSAGDDMDPVDAFRDGDEAPLILADGFQRRLAYLKSGRMEMPVRIRRGTESDALEFAMRINCSHGAAMTNADKRRCVELAVADARMGQFSDKKLAAICRVGLSLVGQVRRGESPAAVRAKRERAEKERGKKDLSKKDLPQKDPAQKRSAAGKKPESATRGVSAHVREEVATHTSVVSDRVKTIKDWIKSGQVDEADVIAAMATESRRYRWFAKDGRKIRVKLRGKANRYREFTAMLDSLEDDMVSITVSKGFKFEVEG